MTQPAPAQGQDALLRTNAFLRQSPGVLWLTGLSGAGKSTIALVVRNRLLEMSIAAGIVDGDELRTGVSLGLGFSPEDRGENVRRAAEVARLMCDTGLFVIVALISPMRAHRDLAKSIVHPDRFHEIFIDTPIEVAEARDPKGLYRSARMGYTANFTGVGSEYQIPLDPDFHIRTEDCSPQAAAELLIRGVLSLHPD